MSTLTDTSTGTDYIKRMNTALNDMPNNLSSHVGADVLQRITDWLSNGGKDDDAYILQQVRYVEKVAETYREEK